MIWRSRRRAGCTSSRERVDAADPVRSGIDTIEVTGVDLSILGHGYFAEAHDVLYDMHAQLITRGAPPNERFGLHEAKNEEGERYWLIGA